MAAAFREERGAECAIQTPGGVRASIRAGPITERDLMAVSPFGNQMVLARLPGAVVTALLEDRLVGRGSGLFISGGRMRYDLSRPAGRRLVEFTIGGAAVDSSRIYTVAMTDYLAEGNSGLGRLTALPPDSFLPAGFTDRDVLSRYLRKQGEIAPSNDGRCSRVSGGSGLP
jgi:5'-nucleotidase